IEFKSCEKVRPADLKGLKALQEEHSVKRAMLVCLEKEPRLLDSKIEILPWRIFCNRLWADELIH
ncbi:MAG TPA: AAA family ATPase, partial [Deltaproteobacteria bacterium]|nr:AAA family ATPase [Deltaproteobacteria bacterium]